MQEPRFKAGIHEKVEDEEVESMSLNCFIHVTPTSRRLRTRHLVKKDCTWGVGSDAHPVTTQYRQVDDPSRTFLKICFPTALPVSVTAFSKMTSFQVW